MCQLLGMNCNTPTDMTFAFSGFAQRGGITDHHADGWGIGFFEGNGLRHFVEHKPAAESPVADLIRRYPIKFKTPSLTFAKPLKVRWVFKNCHPFVRELWGRYSMFAHNGNLKSYSPRLHGSYKVVGTTDSEQAFGWLFQEMAKSHAALPRLEALTLTLQELVPQEASMAPLILCFPMAMLCGRMPLRICII